MYIYGFGTVDDIILTHIYTCIRIPNISPIAVPPAMIKLQRKSIVPISRLEA